MNAKSVEKIEWNEEANEKVANGRLKVKVKAKKNKEITQKKEEREDFWV